MKCSYCGGTEFYEGPSGGMSVNVLCANDNCRHWFNYQQPPINNLMEDLYRIEPSEEEKETEEEQRRRERRGLPFKVYNEGVDLFYKGGTARDCIQHTEPIWHHTHGSDIYRLAGFIDSALATLQNKE